MFYSKSRLAKKTRKFFYQSGQTLIYKLDTDTISTESNFIVCSRFKYNFIRRKMVEILQSRAYWKNKAIVFVRNPS